MHSIEKIRNISGIAWHFISCAIRCCMCPYSLRLLRCLLNAGNSVDVFSYFPSYWSNFVKLGFSSAKSEHFFFFINNTIFWKIIYGYRCGSVAALFTMVFTRIWLYPTMTIFFHSLSNFMSFHCYDISNQIPEKIVLIVSGIFLLCKDENARK